MLSPIDKRKRSAPPQWQGCSHQMETGQQINSYNRISVFRRLKLYYASTNILGIFMVYSTVTLFARFLGWSTSRPRIVAI